MLAVEGSCCERRDDDHASIADDEVNALAGVATTSAACMRYSCNARKYSCTIMSDCKVTSTIYRRIIIASLCVSSFAIS